MIELLEGFPDNTVAVACKGHITKHDYETVIVPRVHEAFERHDRVRIYYQIGSDFEGIDPSAAWEDFKIGMSHLRHWERIAIVTDVGWIRRAMKAFGFLIAGEVRFFPLAETDKAREWIIT